jgi:TonB family protein
MMSFDPPRIAPQLAVRTDGARVPLGDRSPTRPRRISLRVAASGLIHLGLLALLILLATQKPPREGAVAPPSFELMLDRGQAKTSPDAKIAGAKTTPPTAKPDLKAPPERPAPPPASAKPRADVARAARPDIAARPPTSSALQPPPAPPSQALAQPRSVTPSLARVAPPPAAPPEPSTQAINRPAPATAIPLPAPAPAPVAALPIPAVPLPDAFPRPAAPPPSAEQQAPPVRLALIPPAEEPLEPLVQPVPLPEPPPEAQAPPTPEPEPPHPQPAKPRRSAAAPQRMDITLGQPLEGNVTPHDSNAAEGMIHVRGAAVSEDWHEKLQEWWAEHGYYPPEAARRLQQGKVQVHVRMDRDGHVKLVDLDSQSGSQWLDAGALAVFRRETLPALPAGDRPGDQTIDFDVTITYRLIER